MERATRSPDRAAGNKVSRSGGKVTVACKLPHGLQLRCFRMVETAEPVMGGGSRLVPVAQQVGEPITINGNAVAFGAIPNFRIVAGYALTEGIDKDFFDKWREQNAELPAVKNRLIFAYEKSDVTADAAKECVAQRSGLEPLLQDKDPRAPGRIKPGLKQEAA